MVYYGEIAQKILVDILRISPTAITGNFLMDLVKLIILPSIVLIIFLKFVTDLFLRGHKWMSNLLAVALFLLIIVNGWYGPFAEFATNYMILFLIFAGILFFITRFVVKESAEKLGKGFSPIGKIKSIRDAQFKLRHVNRKLNQINTQLARLEADFERTKNKITEQKIKELQQIRDKLEIQKIELEEKIKELKRIV